MNKYEDTYVLKEDEEISEDGIINKKNITEKVPYS